MRWIDICDGNMQEGSFRCDANVSVRRPGAPLGTRREIKNLNSFRFLQQAIEYEIKWQIETLEDGGKIQQATVLFDPDKGETRMMRSKEDAHDYRYFPDPDLLPLEVGENWIEQVREALPELPQIRRERYLNQLKMFPQDAAVLTSSREISDYFENVLAELRKRSDIKYMTQAPDLANAKHVANWVINDVSSSLNKNNLTFGECPISPALLAELLARIFDNTISGKIAKEVFDAM